MSYRNARRATAQALVSVLSMSLGVSLAQGQDACGGAVYPGQITPGIYGTSDIVLADFTGDGRLDVAAAGEVDQSVSIFPGTSASGFEQARFLDGVSGAFRLAAGDLDGDGDIDLASTATSWGVLCVLLNNGDGTLAEPVFYGAGGRTYDVALADFDGDGDLDAALASAGADAVYIFVNDGSGGFAEQRTVAVSSQPSKLAAGDLDGDGDIDMLVLHGFNQRTVLHNDGAASFEVGQTGSAGMASPGRVVLADVDADGDLDGVAIGNPGVDNYVYRNDGSGAFVIERWVASSLVRGMAVGDVTGDGLPDIVASHSGTLSTPGTSLLVNAGDGTFEPEIIVAQGANALLALGDVDGDGALDALTATPTMTVLPNASLRSGRPTYDLYDTVERPSALAAVDIDGDGHLDVLASTHLPSGVAVLRNDGTGSLLAPVVYEAGTNPAHLAIADIDGDGDPDVALANHSIRTVSILTNDAGVLTLDSTILLNGGPRRLAFGDVDRDGWPDLVATVDGIDEVAVALNRGTGRFGPPRRHGAGDRPLGLALGDANGDGWLDIMTTNTASQDISLLINDGSGGLIAEQRIGVDFVAFGAVRLADVDADGFCDAVLAGSSTTGLLRGIGGGGFGPLERFAGLLGRSPADVADVDGDGRLDIVTTIAVVPQTVDGFGQGVGFAPVFGDSLAIADLTGDGRPELIAADYGDDEIYVLRNRCTAPPCAADLDADGELTIFDFLAFGNLFDLMDPSADFDGDGAFTIFDFLAFQNAFDAGCG